MSIVSNVKVYGLEESLIRSGYPMLTKAPSEEEFNQQVRDLKWSTEVSRDEDDKTSMKHINRSIKLGNAKAGSGHDCALKGIIVQFDLNFTIKAWTEAERYTWFDFVSSCSTAHKLKAMDLDKSYIEYVDDRMVEVMRELQQEFNSNPTKENELKMLYSNPVGMKLTAGMTTNYLQLKTIYKQRCQHKLPEWRALTSWMETLPMFEELCLQNFDK